MRSPASRVLGVVIGASLIGCNSAAQTKPHVAFSNRTESPSPAQPDTPRASDTAKEDGSSSVALLAQKMQAYSKELEPHLKDRAERKSVQPAKTEPANASDVKWKDDTAFVAKDLPRDNATVSDVAPPAHKSTAVDPVPVTPTPAASFSAPAKGAEVPQIIPEGEDFSSATGPKPPLVDSDQLLQQLAGKIRDNPRDLSSQLDYQVAQLLRGEQVPQLKSMAGLPAEDREVVTALLDGLSNFRSNVRSDGNQMLSQKIRPLVEMADRLRSQADLALPSAVLCTKVDGFGVYEPMTPRFGAGKDHRAIIYCEVANFASQMNDKKQWETKLSNEVTLYTETGMVAMADKSKSIVDLSRNRRHDFFIVKMVKFPATLTVGRYVLKIAVTDQQSNRVAETTIPVQIGAQ